eukprot:2239755-Amphidinium_carterae.1
MTVFNLNRPPQPRSLSRHGRSISLYGRTRRIMLRQNCTGGDAHNRVMDTGGFTKIPQICRKSAITDVMAFARIAGVMSNVAAVDVAEARASHRECLSSRRMAWYARGQASWFYMEYDTDDRHQCHPMFDTGCYSDVSHNHTRQCI